MNSSFSNASTPPQRTTRSPASRTSASRVDALYDRQPQVSFINAVASDDDESVYSTYSPGVQREDIGSSSAAAAASASASAPCCWSCRQTQRLRSSLKRIELDYLAQIQTLQQQLKHATAQRALALRERDELLTNSDAAATQQSMIEQEAQSLRVEVMQVMQERQELRHRVQELETQVRSAKQQQLIVAGQMLEDAEAAARQALVSTEEDERCLRALLCDSAKRTLLDALRSTVVTVMTPRRCDAASGTLDNSSTIVSSTFSPNSTSSPGPSDGGRERRTCSPRPSKRRDLLSQPHTQRPPFNSDSPRSGSENTVIVSRALVLSQSVEEAEEKVRKAEWRLEQQRSSFEMQLAEERALTADMQAEVDDLIENELMLLEAEGRCTVEKNAAERLSELCLQHVRLIEQQQRQERKDAEKLAPAAVAAAAQADVLDLVDESLNAAWRVEMSETMNTMLQQLYQLLSATKSARGRSDDLVDLKDCVREEVAEVKEALAALLDTSAQSRVDGDALLEEVRKHFSEVEERQCRQEAFMIAMSSKPTRQGEGLLAQEQQQDQQRQEQEKLLWDLREELAQQRQLTERLFHVLQSGRNTSALVAGAAAAGNSTGGRTTKIGIPMPANPAVEVSTDVPCALKLQPNEQHCDPAAVMLAPAHQCPGAGIHTWVFDSTKRQAQTIDDPSCDDPLGNMTTVSDSTLDHDLSPLRNQSCISTSRFVLPDETLFDPQRIHVDVSAAAEQISALLSDESLSDDGSEFSSPYAEC